MNVAIATVAKDVGTTVTGIQFAITLYTLVMAAFMITGGKIGQIIGRKRAFMIGCVVYGCGSATTALAKSLPVLIVGWSVLEGLGAALIMPAVVALVATNFGRAERPRAYGLVASAGAVAVAVGPLVGGLFTTYASWRWVFVGEVILVLGILAPDTPDGRLAGRSGRAPRPGGDGALRRRPGRDRLRRHPVRHLGLRPAQAGRAAVARHVARGLAAARWWRHPGPLRPVGEQATATPPGRAARPADAQGAAPARRAHGVLLPVHAAGRALLRDSAFLVGCPGALGRRDRGAPPAAVGHPPAQCGGRAEALPARLTAAHRAGRLRPVVPRHRGASAGARRGGRAPAS